MAALPESSCLLRVRLAARAPDTLAVGKGTLLFVKGRCACSTPTIRKLELLLDDSICTLHLAGLPTEQIAGELPDCGRQEACVEFWALCPVLEINAPARLPLMLRATLDDGRTASEAAGSIDLKPGEREPVRL